MSLKIKHKDTEFGVGDLVKVVQKIEEGGKTRLQNFEGTLISINNRGNGKTFTVRRVGENRIGIERIFPLNSPLLDGVEVKRKGTKRVRRAKLYYIRSKSKREVEKMYLRSKRLK